MLRIICFIYIFSFSIHLQAQTLATVGSKKITVQQFNKKYAQVKKQTINPPAPSVFLEDLIRFEVGIMEANRKGLKKNPIVQEKFRQELYKALVETSIGKTVQKIKVNESEMRNFYKRNPDIRTRHILIEYGKNANSKQIEATRKRALEIYAEVKNSKRPFSELVKLYSDDALSKRSGGDIGWQSKTSLVPTYYNAAIKLKKNQIYKGLVRTPYGFHIVQLVGTRNYADANKRQVRTAVFDVKRSVIFNNLFKKIKAKYKIKINKNLLKRIR